MTGNQIRQRFLDFFAERGHRVVRSSSLVPANDPTLLFTNAGMNQFKDVFLGMEKRDYSRATSSQKCVRAGGKHNDLENVGYTRRHHTFFEMLGNFSFGDYFKAEAIEFAWDLITKEWALPTDRLYVTIFREDDDAERLWQKVAGVPKERIFRLDEADNFWQMGETGPCGPCSEIHYDLGPEAADQGRATAFLIHDGVLPSNEGRGYVLRKIMRRALRHAHMVGVEDPFLYQLAGFVAEVMRPGYPELRESVQRVARVVKEEEHRYATTFLIAEKVFNEEVKRLADSVLPGAVAFKLYDTYGLALDEQEDMARERGLTIDREGFEREMNEQRRRARASWKGAEKGVIAPTYQTLLEKGRTHFVGYDHLETHARVIGLLVDQQLVDRIEPGARAELVLDETPFYAETGGQVGDQGALDA